MHLVGHTFIYYSKMHGHSNIKFNMDSNVLYVMMLPPSALLVAPSNVRTELDVSVKCIGREQRDFVWKGSC